MKQLLIISLTVFFSYGQSNKGGVNKTPDKRPGADPSRISGMPVLKVDHSQHVLKQHHKEEHGRDGAE